MRTYVHTYIINCTLIIIHNLIRVQYLKCYCHDINYLLKIVLFLSGNALFYLDVSYIMLIVKLLHYVIMTSSYRCFNYLPRDIFPST